MDWRFKTVSYGSFLSNAKRGPLQGDLVFYADAEIKNCGIVMSDTVKIEVTGDRNGDTHDTIRRVHVKWAEDVPDYRRGSYKKELPSDESYEAMHSVYHMDHTMELLRNLMQEVDDNLIKVHVKEGIIAWTMKQKSTL